MNVSDQQTRQPQHKTDSQGLFQCSVCQRTYTRVDHLARHVRSHRQERPFQCPKCSKAFGRPDLLKRHAACHDADSPNGKRLKRHQINHTPRVSQACKSCASAKIKCDDVKPCGRCRQRGITCEFSGGSNHVKVLPSETSPFVSPKTSSTDDEITVAADMEMGDVVKLPTPSSVIVQNDIPLQQSVPVGPPLPFQGHEMSGFLRGVITPTMPSALHPFSPPNWSGFEDYATRGVLDFTVDGSLDLDDTDFGFLDSLCNDTHTNDIQQEFMPSRDPDEWGHPSTDSRKRFGLGVEAFRRSSLGCWLPAPQDHGDAGLENLSILSDAGGSPDTRVKLDQRCLGENLNRTIRDEFLAMILHTCKPERVPTVVKAFPTPDLLDDLIQSFFFHQNQRTDSFIHIPTFRPNAQKPELLGGIVAMGATLTDVKSLHKLGFAIQEAVRTTLPIRCEEANTTTRQLWLLQAFMCEIETGIWSGIKRRMEIAESHPQILYTMLRRAGRFNRLKRPSSTPHPQETGELLHQKWLEWVEQESLKRLAFHAFIFDAQISMTMLTPPVISYSEMTVPFPKSREIWMAEDAEQWKITYFNRHTSPDQQLNLTQFLQQPTALPEYYDENFTNLIILHGIWGMISQHLQLKSALKRPGHSHAAIELRQQELVQSLQHFRLSLTECHEPPSPEIRLVLELLSMYLHMSLEEIQLFAGKEDLDDARRVLPSLQQWVTSCDSRRAIWHAGQVLAAAREFPPKQLRGFYTIAVYHAGLAMWAYAVISQATLAGDKSCPAFLVADTTDTLLHPPVCLDGPDSPTVQRFVTLARGTPSITAPGAADVLGTGLGTGMVPLSDPEDVMSVVLETLRSNFASCMDGEAPPPLVENLIQLLRDLGRAAGSIGS